MRLSVLTVLFAAIVTSGALGQVKWTAMHEPGSGGAITAISVSPHDSKRMLVSGDMLGVGLSTDSGDSWNWTFGLKGWETADSNWSPTDPNIVWLGTMIGPYRSHDGGATWEEKRQGMPAISGGAYTVPIEKVLYDPDQPHRLLAFGGTSRRWGTTGDSRLGVIWESTDDGDHWSKLTVITPDGSDPSKDRGLNIVAASYLGKSGTKLLCRADGGGIYRSDDDGKSWVKSNGGLPEGVDGTRIATHPTDESIAYVGIALDHTGGKLAPGGVFRTSDGGKTWVKKSHGLGQVITDLGNGNLISSYRSVALAKSSPNVLYTCDGSWAQGVIYKSEDGGENWFPVCTRGQLGQGSNAYVGKVANLETATFAGVCCDMYVAPADANTVIGFNSEFLARSLDGGKTWDDGTAYRPNPSQKDHWRGRGYSGWCSTNVAFNPKDASDSLLLMMDAGKGWRSRDGLKSWKYIGKEPWAWGGGDDAVYSGDVIYMTAGQFGDNLGIHKLTNDDRQTVMAGEKFGLPELHKGGQPTSIYAAPDDPMHVWATIGGKLYATDNGGEKWMLISADKDLQWMAGDPTKPTRFYVSGKASVYVCDDGKTLRNIGGPKPATRGRLHVDASGRVYACLWREKFGGLWRYDNGKWTRLLENAFVYDVTSDPTEPSRIALVTSDDPYHDYTNASGVWISADDGRSWSQANDGMPIMRLACIRFDPHRPEHLVAGSYGSGFFVGSWPKAYKPAGTTSYKMTDEDRDFAEADDGGAAITDAGGLSNGNMSAVGGAGPAGWTDTWGDIAIKRDKVVYKSAPASLRAEGYAGKQGQVHQTLDRKAGEKFKVSGWLKTEGSGKVNFFVQPRNEGWTPVGFVQVLYSQGNHDWQFGEKEVTMPEGTARVSIGILIEGEGKAWLDDVRIEPVQGAAVSLAAGPPTAPSAGTIVPLREFGNAGLEYTYDATSWKIGQSVTTGKDGALGYIQIDATEHGGGGFRLSGQNLTAGGQDQLAVKARVLPGNEAGALVINLIGTGKSVSVPLNLLSADQFKTVAIALPTGDYSKIEQMQIQGSNFSPSAKKLKVQIAMIGTRNSGKIGTTLAEAKPSDATQKAMSTDPRKNAPPKDKPAIAGWGYWPDFPNSWMATHDGFVSRAKQGNIDVVFLGDSITQGWGNDDASLFTRYYGKPYKAVNFGIGGDSTRQVIWRIQNGEADGYKAKLFVVRIGTNNLYADGNSGSDEEIADGVAMIVHLLRDKQPQAKVLLLDILPRQNDYFCGRIDHINSIISKLDDGRNVRYLAMGNAFEVSHGNVKKELFNADQLHLVSAGYELWHEKMQPLFDQMVK